MQYLSLALSLSRGSSPFLIPRLYTSSAFYTFVVSAGDSTDADPAGACTTPVPNPKLTVRSLRRKAGLCPRSVSWAEEGRDYL